MEKEEKPTLEEMFEAYRRYASTMDRKLAEGGAERPTVADTSMLRHTARMGTVRTLVAVAAALLIIIFVLPAPSAHATNLTADWQTETEAITRILKAV